MEDKSRLGLVLAGGGGKGAYFIGVWKALRDFGIDKYVTAISGTSIGALNLILFAQDDIELAEKVWTSISQDQILKIDYLKWAKKIMLTDIKINAGDINRVLSLVQNRNGIFSRDGLIQILDSCVNYDKISNNALELYATAFCSNTLSSEYFRLNGLEKDSINDIILASSALPVIFDPVIMNGKTYYDGGIKDNVPIKPLFDLGIKNFIVVHLSRDSSINRKYYNKSQIIEIVPKEFQGNMKSGTLDFTKEGAKKRIESGYDDTCKILESIVKLIHTQSRINYHLDEFKKTQQLIEKKIAEINNVDKIDYNESLESIRQHRSYLKDELNKTNGR